MGRLMSLQCYEGGPITTAMDEVCLASIFPDEYLRWRGFAARPTVADLKLVERIYATNQG